MKRDTGIDLLRITAMLMVVIAHILGTGGVLRSLESGHRGAAYCSAWFLEIAVFCGVNCFALITGYISSSVKFEYSRIIRLLMQVFFYMTVIGAVFYAVNGRYVAMPLYGYGHWYVTAYSGMFFFIPFFNKLIDALEKKHFKLLIFLLVSVFSVLLTIMQIDIFRFHFGSLWLAVLYFTGAYIKRYGFLSALKKRYIFGLYLLSVLTVLFSKTAIRLIMGEGADENVFITHTSPFIFLSAVFLLALFSRIKFKGGLIIGAIRFFAPLSFGVYLIHTNRYIVESLLRGKFFAFGSMPAAKMMCLTLLSAAGIFIFCALVDYIRLRLFRLLKLDVLAYRIEGFSKKAAEKLLGL